MADANPNAEAEKVVPQAAQFAVGDEVKFEVDGQWYDAVVKAVTPVGGAAAKYTVERKHDGVTGFKSAKYVDEARLGSLKSEDPADQPKKAKKAKKVEEPVTPPAPEEPVSPPAPEEPAVPEAPVVEPAAPVEAPVEAPAPDTSTSAAGK